MRPKALKRFGGKRALASVPPTAHPAGVPVACVGVRDVAELNWRSNMPRSWWMWWFARSGWLRTLFAEMVRRGSKAWTTCSMCPAPRHHDELADVEAALRSAPPSSGSAQSTTMCSRLCNSTVVQVTVIHSACRSP